MVSYSAVLIAFVLTRCPGYEKAIKNKTEESIRKSNLLINKKINLMSMVAAVEQTNGSRTKKPQ